jgi:hypothetical protein
MPDLDPCTVLRAADKAYMDLMTSKSLRVVVDQNGERVEYSTANAVGLLAYIRGLAQRCPSYVPLALAGDFHRRPMRFVY